MHKRFPLENYVGLGILFIVFLFLFGSPFRGVLTAGAASATSTQTINLTVNQTITITLSSTTMTMPSLTPGTPVSSTTVITVSTNSDGGWQLFVKRQNTTTTIGYGATSTFPDATEWNPAANSNAGNATDTTAVGSNLHFRVSSSGTDTALYNSSFWGTSDATGVGNAKYAGFPSSSQKIASTSTYIGTTQTVTVSVRADSPTTQRSGTYSGQVLFTAATLP